MMIILLIILALSFSCVQTQPPTVAATLNPDNFGYVLPELVLK